MCSSAAASVPPCVVAFLGPGRSCRSAAHHTTRQSESKTKGAGASISQVQTRVSELSAEEKDKLLFEVFDMLLQNRTPPEKLSGDLDVG